MSDFGSSLDTLRSSGVVTVMRTAARIHGVDATPPCRRGRDYGVEIVVARGISDPCIPGSYVYRWKIPPSHIQTWHGIRTTTPVRTAADCAHHLPWLDAVAAVDKFLRVGLGREELAWFVERTGRRRARTVVEVADAGAESTMETWVRCMIQEVGLPRPSTQVAVRSGSETFKVDLGYREFRLGIEYDGQWFHAGAAFAGQDARRRAAIGAAGWKLLVFNMRHVLVEPQAMLEYVLTTLCQRGWRPTAERHRYIVRRIRRFAGLWRARREVWTDLALDLTGDAPLPSPTW
ncbi:MAG TPA: hypothetical protein VE172_06480 [Stackebrandtia sp.]|jgi:very-short-patch-repair endonuclease|uniref:hypothetical protein n=1 Tax=Stackebrandtia sp. TaxID=2023065 RepID=UPI002D24BC67|nr:hypothetical protein [Stackebrandtia sp.]HZE38443.1 hypothetical protein [Stackebrandtia sp.]